LCQNGTRLNFIELRHDSSNSLLLTDRNAVLPSGVDIGLSNIGGGQKAVARWGNSGVDLKIWRNVVSFQLHGSKKHQSVINDFSAFLA